MPLNHRYVWSTSFVKELLLKDQISEAAGFRYFLAIMAFDWLQFTLMATTPRASISAWSATAAWLSVAITVLGLPYLYFKNGGVAGQHFLQRYFALSVTVGWKFVAAMFIASWLVPAVLPGQGAETLGWSNTAALAFMNILMFWRIGFHLQSLRKPPERQLGHKAVLAPQQTD